MGQSSGRWLCRVVLPFLALSGLLRADDTLRHIPIPPTGENRDLEAIFRQRFQGAKDSKSTTLIEELLRGLSKDQQVQVRNLAVQVGKGDSSLADLMKNKTLTADPGVKRLVESFFGKKLEDLSTLPQEDRARIAENLQRLLKEHGSGFAKTAESAQEKAAETKTTDRALSPQTLQPTSMPAGQVSEEGSEIKRRLVQLLEKLNEREFFRKIPELQNVIRDLKFSRGGSMDVDRLTARVGPIWNKMRTWPVFQAKNWPAISGEQWAKLLPHKWPQVNVKPPNLPAVSLPNVPAPSGGVPSIGPGVIWLAAAVIFGLACWALWSQRAGLTMGKHERPWRLGPWPVAPGKVASAQELIAAFEYLSLLRFGKQAMAWNHRDIAARLGAADDEQGQAAARLATLYERARYAPASEPLPEQEILSARHDLHLLAGLT